MLHKVLHKMVVWNSMFFFFIFKYRVAFHQDFVSPSYISYKGRLTRLLTTSSNEGPRCLHQ